MASKGDKSQVEKQRENHIENSLVADDWPVTSFEKDSNDGIEENGSNDKTAKRKAPQVMLKQNATESENKSTLNAKPTQGNQTSISGEKAVTKSKNEVSESEAEASQLNKKMKMDDGVKHKPTPAKTIPEDAASKHPVMILHMMRPSVAYKQLCRMKNDRQEFTLSSTIDGQNFEGVGGTVKKAKYDLAVKAISKLFNITTTYIPTK